MRWFWRLGTPLASLAALAGIVAAVLAFSTLQYQKADSELERKPVLQLDCRFQLAADDRDPAANAFILDIPAGGGNALNLKSKAPIYDASGHRYELPAYYPECAVTNYGRLPILDAWIHATAHFWSGTPGNSSFSDSPTPLRIPGLSSGEKYTFILINGASLPATVSIPETVELYRIDRSGAENVNLFKTEDEAAIEVNPIQPAPRPLILSTPKPRYFLKRSR